MPWIKYDDIKLDTHPKETGRYKIKRRDGELGYATFNVGMGWANLITMPNYWFQELTLEQLMKPRP
jgi:hypothetical protein